MNNQYRVFEYQRKMILWKIFYLQTILGSCVFARKYNLHPDVYLSITELIAKYGYPVETHEVTTEDGYIITIYRIPHGKNDNITNSRPILIMPGLLAQAEQFVVQGMTNSSPGYYFADHGYDVWLGNTRGGKHGRRHRNLDPGHLNFWNFSWHQIGVYDLSAIIDHILEATGQEKIFYVGHSQGGTIFYVLNSLRPQYNNRIALACLWAPNGFSKHSDSYLLKPIANNYATFAKLFQLLDMYEFPPSFFDFLKTTTELCFEGSSNEICELIVIDMFRVKSNETDMRLLPITIRTLTSVATFQIMHYAQCMKSRHFRQWDYGKKTNLKIYGSPDPPDYPVENIVAPTVLFYSMNDIFIFEQDVLDICKKMPGCRATNRMRNPQWTHIDYLFSINLEKEILQPTIEYMNNF